jgi:hypothetical protein
MIPSNVRWPAGPRRLRRRPAPQKLLDLREDLLAEVRVGSLDLLGQPLGEREGVPHLDGEHVDLLIARQAHADPASQLEAGGEVGVVDVVEVHGLAERRGREPVPGAGVAIVRADRVQHDDAIASRDHVEEIQSAGLAFDDVGDAGAHRQAGAGVTRQAQPDAVVAEDGVAHPDDQRRRGRLS